MRLWRGIGGALILAVVAVAAMGGEKGVGGKASYEKQPVLQASQLVPAELLQGARFRVDEQVPTDGFPGRFTI